MDSEFIFLALVDLEYLSFPDFPHSQKRTVTGPPRLGLLDLSSTSPESQAREVLVKVPRLLVCIALTAAFSATLIAQQAPTGYHSVACIKVKPENNTEFRKWAAADVHKLAQSRVDGGAVSSWIVLRSVIPTGVSAECDYVIVTMYPGNPPQPMGLEELDAALKKAGITATAQQYVDRRASLSTLISNNMFQNQASVGSFKKGDYFVVNYMKATNMADYVAWEKKAWQPMAEALAKENSRSGWSLNTLVFPGGTDVKFNAVTVDVYPTWDSIFSGDFQHFRDLWTKTHPEMDFGTTFEQYDKLRHQGDVDIFVVQDYITSSK
jgi:hypothetical protein